MTKTPKDRLGVFVAGFRWSGSGAVSDWMAGRNALRQAPNSESSFGEIRAINYGIRNLLLAAEAPRPFGERLGRHALCPDNALKEDLLGSPLSAERGVALGASLNLADLVFTTGARFRIIPGLKMYEHLLNHQLGGDFRNDAEYLDMVQRFVAAARSAIQGAKTPHSRLVLRDETALVDAASGLVALFYDRLSEADRIPIFDNALSGLYPRLFDIISPKDFKKQFVVFVKRDPRDQFAELLKYSGGTFPFMVRSFIKSYAQRIDRVVSYIAKSAGKGERTLRLLDFESFVLDSDGTRTKLGEALDSELREFNLDPSLGAIKFRPEQSSKNIGVWKQSPWKRELSLVSRELRQYLRPEAD